MFLFPVDPLLQIFFKKGQQRRAQIGDHNAPGNGRNHLEQTVYIFHQRAEAKHHRHQCQTDRKHQYHIGSNGIIMRIKPEFHKPSPIFLSNQLSYCMSVVDFPE